MLAGGRQRETAPRCVRRAVVSVCRRGRPVRRRRVCRQRAPSMCSMASWSMAAKPIERLPAASASKHVRLERVQGLARGQRRDGQLVDAGRLERLLDLRVGAEGRGPLLEDEVGAHVGGRRDPDVRRRSRCAAACSRSGAGRRSRPSPAGRPGRRRSAGRRAPKTRSWSYLMPCWPLRSMWKSLPCQSAWAMPCTKFRPAICSWPTSGLTPDHLAVLERLDEGQGVARRWAGRCRRAARWAWARWRSAGRSPGR